MMEDKLQDDVNRGARARALINDPLLQEVEEYLKQAYTDAWLACKTTELREACWHLVVAQMRHRQHLITVLNNGILAERQINEMVAKQAGRPRKAA